MSTKPSLRRRLDYRLLRWQARLDGSWADHIFPWFAALGLAIVFISTALARIHGFSTGNDMATWVQGAWLIRNGYPADITVTGQHLLAPQLAFGFYPIALATKWLSAMPTLVVLQAVALSLGAPALWKIARRVCLLRVGASGATIIAYGAHPMVHHLNLADFHPETLALPTLLWAAYFSLSGRWRIGTLLFILSISWRSDLGLAVAGFGVLLLPTKDKKYGWRFIIFGLAWLFIAQLLLQPLIDGGVVANLSWDSIANPQDALADMGSRRSIAILASMLLPVGLLPLLVPGRLLPFFPPVVLALLSSASFDESRDITLLIAGLFGVLLAVPFALGHLGRRNIEVITVDGRVVSGLALVAALFFVLASPLSPYEQPWSWGRRDNTDQTRVIAIERVPDEARVRAVPAFMGHLATRETLLPWPKTDYLENNKAQTQSGMASSDLGGGWSRQAVSNLATDLVAGVDLIVADTSIFPQNASAALWGTLREELDRRGFEMTYRRDGIRIYERQR